MRYMTFLVVGIVLGFVMVSAASSESWPETQSPEHMHVCTGLEVLWPGDWDGTVRVVHTHGNGHHPFHLAMGNPATVRDPRTLHRRVRCLEHAWPGWEWAIYEPHPYHPDFHPSDVQ